MQGFFSIAPAPAPSGGALSPGDINYVRGRRAWRDTVNGLAGATSTQKAQLMTDMGILLVGYRSPASELAAAEPLLEHVLASVRKR